MGKMKFMFDVRFEEEEEEEEYGRRSHKRRKAQQLKACSSNSEKVCFVLQFEPSDSYYVFVSDVSLYKKTSNSNKELVPVVHLKCADSLSMCGLDSTLYMVIQEPLDRVTSTGVQPVYALDLEHYIDLEQHEHTTKFIKKRHLRTLPPMSCPKVSAAIHPVPNSKNILVLSTRIDLYWAADDFPCDDNVPATPLDDPSTEKVRADFEMYDADTKSWVTLPRFYIRPARKLASTHIFQLYDTLTHSWNKIDIDYSLLYDRYGVRLLDINGFAFVNDHTFVVGINNVFWLTLDLSSLPRGWKVLHKEPELPLPLPLPTSVDGEEKEKEKEKEKKKNEVFIINEKSNNDGCAFDINQHITYDRKVVPLSSFRHRVKVKHHQRLLMTRVGTGNRVCVLKASLRRRKRYPQMVVDVVDVEEDEVRGKPVACFTSQFKKRCSFFVSKCLFVYRPRRCHVMTDRDLYC